MLLPLQTLTANPTLARQGNASTEPPSDADASLTALRWILRSKKTEGACGINDYRKPHLYNIRKRLTQAFPQTLRLLQGKGDRVPLAEHLWIEVFGKQRLYFVKPIVFSGRRRRRPLRICVPIVCLQKPFVFFGRSKPLPYRVCASIVRPQKPFVDPDASYEASVLLGSFLASQNFDYAQDDRQRCGLRK